MTNATADQQVTAEQKPRKPWFKKWWVWLIAVILLIALVNALSGGGDDVEASPAEPAAEAEEAAVEEESEPEPAPEPEVPSEYISALRSAETYSEMMHMSKAGIYDQLTSEHGDQFTAEAAQYAIDNIEADWNNNALESAITYQDMMAMSPAAIYDQLISDFGDQFTPEEAQYAVDNLP